MPQQDPIFRELLRQARRREIIKTKGKPKYPKMPAPRFPVLVERKYAAYLIRLLSPLAQIPKQWVKEKYPSILESYKRNDSEDLPLHLDEDSHDLVLSLTVPMQEAQTAMDLEIDGAVATSMESYAQQVNRHVAARYSLERKIALGNPYELSEPWVQGALQEWTETNRKLVKSLTGESLSRLEAMALEAIQKGTRPDRLTVDILKANQNLTVNRARLIARDQIGKLTASLGEKRSLAMGMDSYTWQTSMDERVRGNPGGRYPSARPSHFLCQGKIGIFGKPTVWVESGKEVPRTGNVPLEPPGFPIQCRCIAANRWEDLLKPIDEELLMDDYVRAEMGLAPWPK